MHRRVKRTSHFRHDCQLPPEVTQWDISSPYDSPFRKWLTCLRNTFRISKNADSTIYFRSNCALRRERKRHTQTHGYRHIIHPFSNFNRRKDYVVSVMWFCCYILEAYIGSFMIDDFLMASEGMLLNRILLAINIFFLLDIINRFFIGYAIDKTRVVVLDQRAIAWRYFTTYFFFDSGAVLGHMLFYFGTGLGPKSRLFLYQLQKLRLARVLTMLDNTSAGMRAFGFRKSNRTAVVIILAAITFLHEFTCIMGFIPVYRDIYNISGTRSWLVEFKEFLQQKEIDHEGDKKYKISDHLVTYMVHLCLVVCHFFGSGTFHYVIRDPMEMFILSIILMIGMTFFIVSVAHILQAFGIANVSETQYDLIHMQITDFMMQRNLPKELKRRIFTYYDYKFNKTYFSEDKILDTFSEHLKMEVLLYSCRNLISEVRIFQGLSQAAVGCILALLKQEIYIPDDVVTSADDTTNSLYFILYGTCGVQTVKSDREMMHIEDGDHCGYIEDFEKYEKMHLSYKIVALEVSEIYALEKKDLEYCCKTYPEIVHKLQTMEKLRARHYQKMFALRDENQETLDNIVDELRRGKILKLGYKRQQYEIT